MTRSTLLIIVGPLVGIAVGFSIGALTGTGGPTPVSAQTTEDRGYEAPPVDRVPSGATRRTSAATSALPEETGYERAPDAVVAQAMDIAGGLANDRRGRGDKVIEGVVQDEDGEPVAGVLIQARPIDRSLPSRVDRGEATAKQRSLEEVVQDAVDAYYRGERSAVEAKTDAEGCYRVEGLLDLRYDVSAWLEGCDVTARDGGRVQAGGTVNFVLRPVSKMTFDVLLPDGSRPERASIRWNREGANGRSGNDLWESSRPQIDIPSEGFFKVTASIQGDLREDLGLSHDLESSQESFSLDVGAPRETITLQLRGRPKIRGRVRIPHPSIANTARIWYGLIPKDGAADEGWLRDFGQSARVRSGRFETENLSNGTYAIASAPHAELDMGKIERVEVSGVDVEIDLEIAPVPAEKCIVVVGTDGRGRGIADLNFSYEMKVLDDDEQSGWVQTMSRGGGEFWVVPDKTLKEFMEGRGKPGAQVEVTLNVSRLGSQKVALSPGRRRIDVSFKSGASVLVTVAAFSVDDHFEKMSARLERRSDDPDRDDSWDWIDNEEVREDGTVKLGPTEPGEHRVRLWLDIRVQGGRSDEVPVGEARFSVGEDDLAITASMIPLYRLMVRFEEETNGNVSLQNDKEDMYLWASVRDKKVEFRNVPAGEYSLHHYDNGNQRMTVRIPEQQDVVFRAEDATCLRVHIYGSGTYKEIGFKDGDVIVAVNGKQFEKAELLNAQMMIVDKESAKLTVYRDGGTIQLNYDPSLLVQDNTQGWMEHVVDPRSK